MKDQNTLTNREFTGCHIIYDQEKGEISLLCDRSVKKLLVELAFGESNLYTTPISYDKKLVIQPQQRAPLAGNLPRYVGIATGFQFFAGQIFHMQR